MQVWLDEMKDEWMDRTQDSYINIAPALANNA